MIMVINQQIPYNLIIVLTKLLSWRSEGTLATVHERDLTGIKDMKGKFNILASANGPGTRTLKLLVIEISFHPLCLKDVSVNPAIYYI